MAKNNDNNNNNNDSNVIDINRKVYVVERIFIK